METRRALGRPAEFIRVPSSKPDPDWYNEPHGVQPWWFLGFQGRLAMLDKMDSMHINGVVGNNPVGFRVVKIGRLTITKGVIDLRCCGKRFFPRAVRNALPKANGKGLQLFPEGFPKPIETTLVGGTGGRSQITFRSRSWVREFVSKYDMHEGEKVCIARVSPTDYQITPLWRDFKFIDLFAGIGGLRLAMETAGGSCVFSSEIDPLAQATYEANFGERPAGDITHIPPESVPDHDVLVGGFPCQPFSIIGNRKGFADTRGTLFFSIEEILRVKRPRAILLENVKLFRTHDNGRTCQVVLRKLNDLGYHTHTTILNALNFGVPQKRERTFIVGFQENLRFSFPSPLAYRPSLATVFERDEDVDPKLFVTQYIREKRLARLKRQGREPFFPSMWHENKGGFIGMHPFSCALRHNASYNYLLVNGYRRPSSRECLRLQGFPDSFKIVVPHTAVRAQAGNAVAVPVVTAIALKMMLALRENRIVRNTLF